MVNQATAHPEVPGSSVPQQQDDLNLAVKARANLLLYGDERSIRRAMSGICPRLATPLRAVGPDVPLELPEPATGGTLVIRDVGRLSPQDQRRLLEWTETVSGAITIVSTTTGALFQQVETESFLAALYYRLNTVVVNLEAP
jgi:hypothetical protein